MLTSAQCIAARELLGWSRPELAAASRTSTNTIRNFELGLHELRPMNAAAIARALMRAGVIFYIDQDDVPKVALSDWRR
jgi:transcriptional regulator with XRE-family HTH domain